MSSTVHIGEVLGFLRNFDKIIEPAETVEEALYLLEKEFIRRPELGHEIRLVSSHGDKRLLSNFIRGMGLNASAHCWWMHKGTYNDFVQGRREMVREKNKAKSDRSRAKKLAKST